MTNVEQDVADHKFSSADRKTLRRIRKKAGLSQADLAARTGIGQQMISRFENGERNLSVSNVSRLLEAITDVIDGKESMERLSAIRSEANQLVKLSDLSGRRSSASDAFNPFSILKKLNLDKTPLEQAQDQIKKLEELVEGYKRLNEISQQLISLLKEADPAKTAFENVSLLERVEKLTEENAVLREWLNAEELAALSNDKAAELRERANKLTVAGMQKENAEEE
jgi:transcriptional regulator with XRE-family HTH domain